MIRAFARLALVAALAGALPARAAIVINEVMYNSVESADVEYVELYNTGPGAQDLTGWYLLDVDPLHDKCFLVGTLAAGAYLVIPGFTDRFTAKYPGVTNLNPNQFDSTVLDRGFSFGNGGDRVRVFNNIGVLIDFMEYDDLAPWPTAANGTGPSLELINPALDNTLASSWAASLTPPDGTPGTVNSRYAPDQAPIVDSLNRNIPLPTATQTVTITARAIDNIAVTSVQLWVDAGSGYAAQPMYDDGAHGDGQAGNSVYGAFIAPQPDGRLVRYYVAATDTFGQTTTAPAGAPAQYAAYTVGYRPPRLVVNEILASNLTGIRDEFGQFEDWVEIRNRGTTPVDLGGMFLTDNLAQAQNWRFPSTVLQPGAFMVVWCDNDVSQGLLHTSFKLPAARGDVGLYDSVDHGNVLVHGLGYALLPSDVSFGYLPDDADAPEYIGDASPGVSNDTSDPYSTIVINEFLTTSSAGGLDDWVEFYNRGQATVDIGGWHLTDERDQPLKYTFPANTLIAPGGFHTVDEITLGFGFTSTGAEIILLNKADGQTGADYFDYGAQTADVSQGRFANGRSNWQFFTTPSRGVGNGCGSGSAPFGGVAGVRFAQGSKSVVEWNALAGAQAYDVVRGDLGSLRSSGGAFAGAISGCPENNAAAPMSWQPDVPSTGAGLFYLVRGVTYSCGFGTYDSGATSQVGSRDDEIALAGSACP